MASRALSFQAAIDQAERRARDSYFDQHVIEDHEAGYLAIDEGDYSPLPSQLIDRIVYTVGGQLLDEH
ncbi:MAG: hypothetical protein J7498_14320 [Sphingobium sp.]|nr:hypothetical protein [Sphingobium sp.]